MVQSAQRDIVVIGASSGGLEALLEIVRRLPPDLPAALFIVSHLPSQSRSYLPAILSRSGPLPATHAEDQEKVEPGRIYVAPPDFHLLLRKEHVRIVRGPRENNHRPAIDPLFRTAARTFGPRVIGIVLSGSLDDGTAGLFAVKARGGITVVQDPADALFPDMPRNALAAVPVDYCLAKSAISKVIVELTQRQTSPTDRGATMAQNSDGLDKEIELEAMNGETVRDEDRPGSPSTFGCPDCGGVLWELHEDQLLRFRCRVGHAYSAEGLLGTQGESLDAALWRRFARSRKTPPWRVASRRGRAPTSTSRWRKNSKPSREWRNNKRR